MEWMRTVRVECPYCWERLEILVDCSAGSREYVEDCQVCRQPLVIDLEFSWEGAMQVRVRRENE